MLPSPSRQTEPPDTTRPILDPGSPGMALVALISLVALVAGTFVLQQMKAAPAPPPVSMPGGASAATAQAVPDGIDDPFVISSKLVVKVGRSLSQAGGSPSPTSPLSAQALNAAKDAAERFRAVVVVGELDGPARAVDQLIRLRTFLDTPTQTSIDDSRLARPTDQERDELHKDIDLAQSLYERGAGALSNADADRLRVRHGWFGKLLFSTGLPDTDPAREPLIKNGIQLMVLLLGVLVLGVLIVIGGFVAFTIAVVRVITKGLPRRFTPPAPGGSVYIETAALFFAGFLVLKFVIGAVSSAANLDSARTLQFALGAQWLILPVIFWPIARGVPAKAHFQMLGLHRGEGVVREVLAGLFGYLAGLPVLLFAMLVTAALIIIRGSVSGGGPGGSGGGGTPIAPPENPVLDVVSKGGLTVAMLYALATLWAPIVEESVFRGALFRYMRSYVPLGVAAILSTLAFGFAHGYEWLALGPVFALGFNFAIMREWRGSLIGPVVAHALHNGTVLAIVITLLSLLK